MSERFTKGRRRSIAAVTIGCAAAIALAPAATAAPGGGTGPKDRTATITVMGTSDLHGYIENWDYFTNAEYDDAAHNDVGLAKVSGLINQVRADRGAGSTVLIDAGDTIQGTSLTDYFANVQPVDETGESHPMAAAMNAMGYDAAALGNHEFNYGLPLLRTFEDQLDFPLLGANVVDWDSGAAAFTPYVIKTVKVTGQKPIRVGILGLTNPGVAIWDKNNVEGELRFPGIVEQARKYVPEMKAAGADVVVVSSHSGTSGTSSYGGDLPTENASTELAEQVPGIDAVLVGHAHQEIPERFVTNEQTGESVLLTEPKNWGMRLSVMDFELTKVRGQWDVTSARSELLNANTVPADPVISTLISEQHQRVIDYVNTAIGTATETMSAADARFRDTAVMDFVNEVQAGAVAKALEGTPNADLPVLSIVAPFNRAAVIPEGPVTIRDVAGLYVFPNTLFGVEMTGAQVKDYLEYSARYFTRTDPGAPVDPATLTNADGTPDYNYDMMSGVSYDIDISKPVGQRITDLTYAGAPIDPAQRFAVATNNYRQSGGGNFPHIATAPVLVNQTTEIRQLLIDYLITEETIDPSTFFEENWQLTRDGEPVFD
ncbi:bifunctional metallophosphatase/5'-nucleotidase [Arthrobacter agilis]|uniref:bifunctional metallophosphatase/5'-nucleotidase n=1 Tax=Arthrobacter agilis TaxID=37921 RepID=UPI000B35C5E7|nr:5'-nucleotidase C-terminal domain-containing protein [Arthrobacter agilis]OUM40671.1 bifunctional metallophosphatase/5'-nucleotidase [Arthrobacter agilis]PPB45281.1 bifunctional metallophosphatase/5'-nucleotidase [Arthrobacter agilis]TPV27988.1 bifunctional metallophosphatase/5'-nucleotidase [Arthrobacter agilis]VDR31320.1 Trifunctional nucleotide phosphoesterase protein YfkN precursor [Arthrobacter agilis]